MSRVVVVVLAAVVVFGRGRRGPCKGKTLAPATTTTERYSPIDDEQTDSGAVVYVFVYVCMFLHAMQSIFGTQFVFCIPKRAP